MSDIIVYGATCTWWDNIQSASTGKLRIPCCPKCGSVLFQVDSMEQWLHGAKVYENDGHTGYVKMLEWAKGKCYRNMIELEKAYKASLS